MCRAFGFFIFPHWVIGQCGKIKTERFLLALVGMQRRNTRGGRDSLAPLCTSEVSFSVADRGESASTATRAGLWLLGAPSAAVEATNKM